MSTTSTTTTTAPFVFSRLPTELLGEIFEHAAATDRKCAIVMSLVSTWVRLWTERHLYHTVVLSSSRDLRSFILALSRKDVTFPQAHVKHLGIFALGPLPAIEQVLEACRGVNSLACGFPLPGCQSLQKITSSPPTTPIDDCEDPDNSTAIQLCHSPKEQHFLGMACRDGWDTNLVASTVTHLRLQLPSCPSSLLPFNAAPPSDDPEVAGWDRLSTLPSLTHLAIVYRPSPNFPILSIFAHLQQLLFQGGGKTRLNLILVQVIGMAAVQGKAVVELNEAAMKQGGNSMRIVAEAAPMSAVVQWEESVRSGKTVWEMAEEEVDKRFREAEERV